MWDIQLVHEILILMVATVQNYKAGRIRFEVRIAINLMHRIRVFESDTTPKNESLNRNALKRNKERSANQD